MSGTIPELPLRVGERCVLVDGSRWGDRGVGRVVDRWQRTEDAPWPMVAVLWPHGGSGTYPADDLHRYHYTYGPMATPRRKR